MGIVLPELRYVFASVAVTLLFVVLYLEVDYRSLLPGSTPHALETAAISSSQTVEALPCQKVCAAWDARLSNWTTLKNERNKMLLSKTFLENFFALPSEWPCKTMKRVGASEEESSLLCLEPQSAQQSPGSSNCSIFSFGSSGDFSFEEDIHGIYPQCMIHKFDPLYVPDEALLETLRHRKVFFHSTGLTHETLPHYFQGDSKPFASIPPSFNVSSLLLLKMNCEGCDFKIFPDDIFPAIEAGVVHVQQLIVELHIPRQDVGRLRTFFEWTDRLAFRLVETQFNTMSMSDWYGVEYTFVRATFPPGCPC